MYSRADESVEHAYFRDLPDYLEEGDLLVINNTKVIPARIFGHMEGKATTFELLLLKRLDYTRWETIMRPARKARKGSVIKISDELSAEVEEVGEYGVRTVKFDFDGVFEDILDRVGNMPLPPYIHEKLADKTRYNTVYSKTEGSAAAPTAGLHFTPELMERVRARGADFAEVLLHIGLGTFRPVKAEKVTDHEMHTEHYEISPPRRRNKRRETRGQKGNRGGDDCRARAGIHGGRERLCQTLHGGHENLHLSPVPLQVRGRADYQFPPAGVDADYVGVRAHRARTDT